MPELPEVETIARQLRERQPALLHRTIAGADVRWAKTVATHAPQAFARAIEGLRIADIGRHGKTLVITLRAANDSPPAFLMAHLRMSGRLEVVPAGDAITKHARVVIYLDDGLALRFDDARKFGRIWLVGDPREVLADKGPDALAISEADFVARLKKKKGALKPILLDQRFVAGVGNIYADESLFRARLRPTRTASRLTRIDAARLHGVVQAVLHEAIRANGASFDWVYPDGNFQNNFRVYGRTGRACDVCETPIKRILVGQRSTHFCPTCQK